MTMIPLLLAACLAPEVHEVPADDVMKSVRQVLGSGSLASMHEGVRASGTCREHGMEGTFEFQFDAEGRFRHAVKSSLGETVAFDSEIAWSRDASGLVRRLDFGGRIDSQGWLWVLSGYWALPGSPFTVTRLENFPGPEDSIALRLARSDEPWEATLFVDASGFLPRELVRQRAAGERRYRFTGWTNSLGLRYPGKVEVVGISGDVSSFETETVAKAPTFVRSPYAPLFRRPNDTHFDTTLPAGVAARRTSTGHLLIHPRVNDKDVGWFILDSGAGAVCIDPKVADRLGMVTVGETSVVGGAGATRGRIRSGARLRAGPATLPNLPWLELDTGFLSELFGVPVAGVLGYELFARAVIEIDLASGRVLLSDPGTYTTSGPWLPLRLDDRIPCVEASYEGDRRGWFRIDTGSDDTLAFHTPAVQELGLLFGRMTVPVTYRGVGGEVSARRGDLDWLELSDKRFEDLPATFSTATVSGLATPYTTGTLGVGVLDHFRLVFDYGGERILMLSRGR